MKWYVYYYIIVFILILFIVIRIFNFNETNNIKSLNSLDSLNTGDLVFVKYDNSLGYLMRLWSGSKWTHMGMIYRNEIGDLFVMETANYSKDKGVLLIPLYRWQRFNKNCEISIMKLNAPEDFDRNVLYENFQKLRGKKLDTFNTKWIRLITKHKYKNLSEQQNITCYELIVHILQESNIVKKIYSPSSYFPKDFIDKNIPYETGFSYS